MPNQFTTPDAHASAQTTNHIFMVRPANFGSNPETAKDNEFQHKAKESEQDSIADRARKEFDAFVVKLRAAGVDVMVVEDTPSPVKIDAVFPNNWITTHDDGVIVTYPVLSEIRRLERRADIVEQLADNFRVSRYIALESWEEQGRILEGTGSMILDRENRIAYACISKRTELESLREWAMTMRYETVVFTAVGRGGIPIYHTNVMMAVGTAKVVICLNSIPDINERNQVVESIEKTGKQVIDISLEQMEHFAGNMLELIGKDGPVWGMSSAAYKALTEEQIARLQSSKENANSSVKTQIVHSDLTTIETYGGGSARCMMAEIFLPEN